VRRAIEILEDLSDAGGTANITLISRRTGIAIGSTHRLLRTMVDLGLVGQLPSREYGLGPTLARLGIAASRLANQQAMPYLTRIVDEFGETASLAVRDNDSIIYIAEVPSTHTAVAAAQVGQRVPPHCTGVGKALLAQLDDAVIISTLERVGMPRMTPKTITTAGGFLQEVRKIRRAGFALDDEEQRVGVRCIAVPLPGTKSRLALSMSGAESRFANSTIQPGARLLKEVATDLAIAMR
jgi:IclR family acetate operon transcriptional repressor